MFNVVALKNISMKPHSGLGSQIAGESVAIVFAKKPCRKFCVGSTNLLHSRLLKLHTNDRLSLLDRCTFGFSKRAGRGKIEITSELRRKLPKPSANLLERVNAGVSAFQEPSPSQSDEGAVEDSLQRPRWRQITQSGANGACKDVGDRPWRWQTLAVGALVAALVMDSPSVDSSDMRITFSANRAVAAPLGQMRPGGMLFEKIASSFKSSKVLDKVVTVVSGQTIVDPRLLEKEAKEILQGENNFEEWRNGVLANVQDLWTTAIDVVSHFTPESFTESAGASVQGFLEAGAERFAAFELSTLVGLVERSLIYTPFVILPMAWQMRARKAARAEDARAREERRLVLSEEVQAKAERVRHELECIGLKASLFKAIESIGEPVREGSSLRRQEINDMIERLQQLNPVYDVPLTPYDLGSAVGSSGPNDSFAYGPATPNLDGDWRLIYMSDGVEGGRDREVPQIPGIGIHNLHQQVWHKATVTGVPSLAPNTIGSPLMVATNVAELRLGPLGVLEVSVQGSWETLRNGQAALVSFDIFSARLMEIFGNRVSDELPVVSLLLPRALQQSAEWEVLYLDENTRINRGQRRQLFLFQKIF